MDINPFAGRAALVCRCKQGGSGKSAGWTTLRNTATTDRTPASIWTTVTSPATGSQERVQVHDGQRVEVVPDGARAGFTRVSLPMSRHEPPLVEGFIRTEYLYFLEPRVVCRTTTLRATPTESRADGVWVDGRPAAEGGRLAEICFDKGHGASGLTRPEHRQAWQFVWCVLPDPANSDGCRQGWIQAKHLASELAVVNRNGSGGVTSTLLRKIATRDRSAGVWADGEAADGALVGVAAAKTSGDFYWCAVHDRAHPGSFLQGFLNKEYVHSAVAARAPAAAPPAAAPESDPECVVCLSSVATHAMYPCGHQCVCEGCGERLLASGKYDCPICRQASMNAPMRIFRS